MPDSTPPHQPKPFQPPTKGEAILVNGQYYFVGEKIGKARLVPSMSAQMNGGTRSLQRSSFRVAPTKKYGKAGSMNF